MTLNRLMWLFPESYVYLERSESRRGSGEHLRSGGSKPHRATDTIELSAAAREYMRRTSTAGVERERGAGAGGKDPHTAGLHART
jgi:hypothetical protein